MTVPDRQDESLKRMRGCVIRSLPADKNSKPPQAVFYTSHFPFFITALKSSDGIGLAK